MASYHVTCKVMTAAPAAHHFARIYALGGPQFWDLEARIIALIENGINNYYTLNFYGVQVPVVVASFHGVKYLKTKADGETPDNLLSLPDCTRKS